MEYKRFLEIAADWGVKEILKDHMVSDNGVAFQDVYLFESADWAATSLKLARALLLSQLKVDQQEVAIGNLKDELDQERNLTMEVHKNDTDIMDQYEDALDKYRDREDVLFNVANSLSGFVLLALANQPKRDIRDVAEVPGSQPRSGVEKG